MRRLCRTQSRASALQNNLTTSTLPPTARLLLILKPRTLRKKYLRVSKSILSFKMHMGRGAGVKRFRTLTWQPYVWSFQSLHTRSFRRKCPTSTTMLLLRRRLMVSCKCFNGGLTLYQATQIKLRSLSLNKSSLSSTENGSGGGRSQRTIRI